MLVEMTLGAVAIAVPRTGGVPVCADRRMAPIMALSAAEPAETTVLLIFSIPIPLWLRGDCHAHLVIYRRDPIDATDTTCLCPAWHPSRSLFYDLAVPLPTSPQPPFRSRSSPLRAAERNGYFAAAFSFDLDSPAGRFVRETGSRS